MTDRYVKGALQTTITAIAVHMPDESPIFGERTTTIRLDDEGGGPFIVIEQLTDTQPSVVKLDPEEVALVMRTASRLLRQESIDRARGKAGQEGGNG